MLFSSYAAPPPPAGLPCAPFRPRAAGGIDRQPRTPTDDAPAAAPPTPLATPRVDGILVAEFAPMEAVLVRYPLGLPASLVAAFSKDLMVVVICEKSEQAQATQVELPRVLELDQVHRSPPSPRSSARLSPFHLEQHPS